MSARALAASWAAAAEHASSTVTAAFVHTAPRGALRVVLKRAQKDILSNRMRTYLHTFHVDPASGVVLPSLPAALDVVAFVPSPSGRYNFTLRKEAASSSSGSEKPACVIAEVSHTDTGAVLRCVRIDAGLHGDVICDAWWGEPVWSSDDRYVAYIADVKATEEPSLFAPLPAVAASPPQPDRQAQWPVAFDYDTGVARECWGERYESVRLPRLFIFDIAAGRVVAVPGTPDGVSCGQPCWMPLPSPPRGAAAAAAAGASNAAAAARRVIAYTGWKNTPRRLGIVYCHNRPCGVYAVDVTDAVAPAVTTVSSPSASTVAIARDDMVRTPSLPTLRAADAATALPAPSHVLLTPGDAVARCGRFVGGGSIVGAPLRLVYLAAAAGSPSASMHNGPADLKVADFGAWWDAGAAKSSPTAAPTPSFSPVVASGLATRAVLTSVASPGGPTNALQLRAPPSPTGAPGDSGTILAPFPSLFVGGLHAHPATPDGSAVFLTADVGSRLAVLRIDISGDATTATIVDESVHGLASLPSWSLPIVGGKRLGVNAADVVPGSPLSPGQIFAAAVEDACAGSVALLAACPLHGSGRGAMALVLSASTPTCPERVTIVVTGLEPSRWLSLTERRTTVTLPLPCAPAAGVEDASTSLPSLSVWPRGAEAGRTDLLADAIAAVSSDLSSVSWRLIRVNPLAAGSDSSSDVANDATQRLPPSSAPFHAIALFPTPKSGVDPVSSQSLPLVVVPHGGPHSSFTADFLAPYAWLASRASTVPEDVGSASSVAADVTPNKATAAHVKLAAAGTGRCVLLVNYRGSTGYGVDAMASLPGRIGTADVDDVYAAAITALQLSGMHFPQASVPTSPFVGGGGAPSPTDVLIPPQPPLPVRLSASRVAVVGGSHGGFLGAHVAGRHPELFKASVLRNPVTNIASMVTTTDIPDWYVRELCARAQEVVLPHIRVAATLTPERCRCWVETLGIGSYDYDRHAVPPTDSLATMYAASPIRYLVARRVQQSAEGSIVPQPPLCPTLLLLGLKDRRVPASQGIEYLHAAKGRGVDARCVWYLHV